MIREGSAASEKIESKAEIKLPEVRELREPTQKILDALREHINAGDYTVILGDETSARIPTRVFRGVLARLYEDQKRRAPQTVFVGAPKMLPDDQAKREKIADYLTGQLKDIPQGRDRALVITEALRSGDTIKPLVDTLKELGVQFDLASIGVETFQLGQQDKLEELMPELESKLGTRVYFGMEGTPKIYQKEHFAGVRKNPNTGASEPLPDWLRKGNQRWINQAREEAEILADDLAKWFRETNNQSAREG